MTDLQYDQKPDNQKQKLNLSNPFVIITGSIFIALFFLLVFFKINGPIPLSVSQTTVEKTTTFDVTESAEKEIVPDEAVVTLGIQVSSPNISSTQEQANTVINSITDKLLELGIKEGDIKTTNYTIYPNYREDGQPQTYEVTANIKVSVNDFDILEQAIDSAVSLGATNVGGISFSVSDLTRDDLEDELRNEAINKAKEKAEKIANSAGIKLGKIINISEDTVSPQPPMYFDRALTMEASGSPETQVSPGTSTVIKTVTLSYETL